MRQKIAKTVGASAGRENTTLSIPSVDLPQLRYCLAAVEQGSLRKAAIRLGVRESTVSRRIRDLELQLGAALFIRHLAGVRPTAAGERFARQAQDILGALGAAVAQAAAIRGGSGWDGRIEASWPEIPIAPAC